MPHPSSHNILSTKCLINRRQIFQHWFKITITYFCTQSLINLSQSIIHLVNIFDKIIFTWFGISKNAYIFDVGFDWQLFMKKIESFSDLCQVGFILLQTQSVFDLVINIVNCFSTLSYLFSNLSKRFLIDIRLTSLLLSQHLLSEFLYLYHWFFCTLTDHLLDLSHHLHILCFITNYFDIYSWLKII